MSAETDFDLVEQAKAELPYSYTAYETLVRRHSPGIRRIILGMLGSADEADSLVQDVMLRMMHGLPQLKDGKLFGSWLRRIAVNTTKSYFSRKNREAKKQDHYLQYQMSQATPQTGELNEPEFDYYMSLLSIEERALVSFKVLEDLEFSEIAKILGLSLSAVKMRYYRALEKIQSRLT